MNKLVKTIGYHIGYSFGWIKGFIQGVIGSSKK